MKRLLRYINSAKQVHRKLSVDIILDIIDMKGDVAASYVVHPENIKRRKKLSELKLTILNDVVASARSSILSQKFPILKEYQSKSDYTYYILFQPEDSDGNKLTPIEIKFRIATHRSKSIPNNDVTTSTVRIKSFILSGRSFENSVEFITAFGRICSELRKGNIAVLDEY